MLAARTGRVEAIEALLKAGADVNAAESLRGTTALMWAVSQAHPGAVQALVAAGAEVAARSRPAPLGRTAYLAPSARQHAAQVAFDNVRAGEEAAGRRPSAEGGGLTPLVYAAREGDLEFARILLDAGAEVDQATQYGWTALLTATQNRHYVLASFAAFAAAQSKSMDAMVEVSETVAIACSNCHEPYRDFDDPNDRCSPREGGVATAE